MKTVTLGRSGIEVPELCLGTMTWGRQNTAEEGFAQMDAARAHGGLFLDTAEMYPTQPVRADSIGRTEEIIGAWLSARKAHGQVVVATKVLGEGNGFVRDGAPIDGKVLRAALEASLRRLRCETVDLYQLHWPNRGSYHFRNNWGYDPTGQHTAEVLANLHEVMETLAAVQREGKIRAFGLSNETAWGMAQWLRLAEAGVGPRAATIQNEYSLMCRLFDTDLAELCHHEAVTLLAFSPLAAGLLSGKYQGDATPEASRRALTPDLGGRIAPRAFAAVGAYLEIAQRHGLDPVQMALAWCRMRPVPTIPIIGATSLAQLELALASAEVVLSVEVLAEIEAAHRAHPLPY